MSEADLYQRLGTAVAERRKTLGITQAQLARRLKLSRASIANLESGRQRVMLHHLYRLAAALELPSILELTPPAWSFDDAPARPRFEGSELTSKQEALVDQFLRSAIEAKPTRRRKP